MAMVGKSEDEKGERFFQAMGAAWAEAGREQIAPRDLGLPVAAAGPREEQTGRAGLSVFGFYHGGDWGLCNHRKTLNKRD